jgi:hypothetical protein
VRPVEACAKVSGYKELIYMVPARVALGFLLMSGAAVAQQYMISTVAGGAPPPTPIAALNAGIGAP